MMLYMLVIYVSPRCPMCLGAPVAQFVMTCGVVVFAVFYCLLDLSCCECNVI